MLLSMTLRLSLSTCLLLAGSIKLADPNILVEALQTIYILQPKIIITLSYTIPMLELLTGYLLISSKKEKTGPVLCMGMFSLFTLWLIINLALTTSTACGCFGVWDPLENRPMLLIIRGFTFTILSIWLWKLTKNIDNTEEINNKNAEYERNKLLSDSIQ
jgi:hypothetical protein